MTECYELCKLPSLVYRDEDISADIRRRLLLAYLTPFMSIIFYFSSSHNDASRNNLTL
jgi:hypothetical protein